MSKKIVKLGPLPTPEKYLEIQRRTRRFDKYILPATIFLALISFVNVHKFATKGDGGNAVWAAITIFAGGLIIGQVLAQRSIMKIMARKIGKNGKDK